MGEKFPHHCSGLFQHLEIIHEAYTSFGGLGWFYYAESFHQKRAIYPQLKMGYERCRPMGEFDYPSKILCRLSKHPLLAVYNLCTEKGTVFLITRISVSGARLVVISTKAPFVPVLILCLGVSKNPLLMHKNIFSQEPAHG